MGLRKVIMSRRCFFMSDTHFGHGNIIKYCHRPFLSDSDKKLLESLGGVWNDGNWKVNGSSNVKVSRESIEIMDDELMNQINSLVGKDDILWHLGDFAMYSKHESDSKYYNRCKEYRNRIKCKNVNLVWGNHDENIINDLFNETHDLKNLYLPDIRINIALCHYAMAIFNKSHRKAMHLYGHSHSLSEAWLDRVMKGRRSMDVGVDNAAKLVGKYRPFELTEILAFIGNEPGHVTGDHHIDPNAPSEESLV